MAESIISDGQNQSESVVALNCLMVESWERVCPQVPSDFHDRGQPPIVTTNQPVVDSPLSPVSSEDLDISSPLSDGYKPTPYQDTSKPRSSMDREDRIAVGGAGDSERLNTSNVNTSITSTDSGGSPRRKPRHETDIMKLSAMSGDGYTDSLSSSRPASAASSRSPYKEKEAERRQKEKEKEERFRLARQRMAEERQRKLIELKEQQRIAQENRERQLELRRKKIEELRKREDERRAAVEERRLKREATEKNADFDLSFCNNLRTYNNMTRLGQ
ncbi:hypothetical protein LOTGIDRAFT_161782 [Lottia gigantea]|uniref:Uncharacterized protein n=1 Tax=Lottia gigantea TaxID=225164 RepID=V4ADM8_LOTGI|nr:hypothetical protein LOTGIDRAFT_161782 [Lottia gigantea]ESO93230.1 hypothetical protein LOTGIDRAFT_161782 [Lottia gigantea]